MGEIPLRHVALYALGLLLIVGLGLRHLGRDGGGSAQQAPASAPAIRVERGDGGTNATVHVAGAVRRPGVYRLKAGARVDDAVARAGGPTPTADLSAVNLAAKAEDGRQVLVPRRAPAAAATSLRDGAPSSGAAGAASGSAGATAGAGAAPATPVNLNTATLEQLDALDGIGPATAQAILDHRQEHGGFGSLEELAQIPGIGPKRMATLRELVRL